MSAQIKPTHLVPPERFRLTTLAGVGVTVSSEIWGTLLLFNGDQFNVSSGFMTPSATRDLAIALIRHADASERLS